MKKGDKKKERGGQSIKAYTTVCFGIPSKESPPWGVCSMEQMAENTWTKT